MAASPAVDAGLVWYLVAVQYLHNQVIVPFIGAAPAFRAHVFSVNGIWFWVVLVMVTVFLPYFLFQKHCLPHWMGRLVGRAYFWPCIPCSVVGNYFEFKGDWIAPVDEEAPAVYLGQAPLFRSQQQMLTALNCKAVVNLCDEYAGPACYRQGGISVLWLKTIDHLEPTVEAMHTACSFIEHQRAQGNAVYIHCKSGRGRSAAIAMGWLMHARRMTPKEAQLQLLSKRKVRAKLWVQRNIIRFYHAVGKNPPSPSVMERGEYAERSQGLDRAKRGISFAVQGGGRGSVDRKQMRDVLRMPTQLEEECAVGVAPPNWSANGGGAAGGVWEIAVAPQVPTVHESMEGEADAMEPSWVGSMQSGLQRSWQDFAQPAISNLGSQIASRSSIVRRGSIAGARAEMARQNAREAEQGQYNHYYPSAAGGLVSDTI